MRPGAVVEAHGQSLRQDLLLDPVDERMERRWGIANGSAAAMSESGDVEVAEEIIRVGIEVCHAAVVVVGCFVWDDGVGLDGMLADFTRKKGTSAVGIGSLYVGGCEDQRAHDGEPYQAVICHDLATCLAVLRKVWIRSLDDGLVLLN